jgi:AAA+ lid domain
MEVIARLLENERSEVLITFMLDWVNRFLEHPDEMIAEHYDKLFGDKGWRQLVQAADRFEAIRAFYAEQLRKVVPYVWSFSMLNERSRPIYFDRQVEIPLPNLRERSAILTIHAKGKRLGPDVDLEAVARGTPGFSGADLANLVNEAAIVSIRAGRDIVTARDFADARDRLLLGRREATNALLPDEKRAVAVTRLATPWLPCTPSTRTRWRRYRSCRPGRPSA